MALVTNMGTRVAARRATRAGLNIGSHFSRTAALTTAVGAVGLLAAARGFNTTSGDLSDALYEITTGNPNIDEEVFGMPMSARSLLLPMPDFTPEFLDSGPIPSALTVEGRRRLRLMMQPQILGRFQANQNRMRNRMPSVNGNIVHGLYNGRGG